MMRVAVLAPIQTSLYSRVVTHLCLEDPGLEVVLVVVRTPWTWRRIVGEIRRDGPRLVRKIYQKLILGDAAFDANNPDTLRALAERSRVPEGTLADLVRPAGVPLVTVRDHNDAESAAALAAARPDVIAFTGGGLIRGNILEIPTRGVLNAHQGMLPLYRGMDAVEFPVAEGRHEDPGVGLTLHFMDRGVDTGPILLRRPLAIRAGDTFETLRRRMEPLMAQTMIEGIRGLRDGTLYPQPQDPAEGRQYFMMHPRVQAFAERRLEQLTERLRPPAERSGPSHRFQMRTVRQPGTRPRRQRT